MHNPSKQATAHKRPRPHGHWDRSFMTIFLPKGYLGAKIKENETEGHAARVGKEKCNVAFSGGN